VGRNPFSVIRLPLPGDIYRLELKSLLWIGMGDERENSEQS
jgi:hypothetical protein